MGFWNWQFNRTVEKIFPRPLLTLNPHLPYTHKTNRLQAHEAGAEQFRGLPKISRNWKKQIFWGLFSIEKSIKINYAPQFFEPKNFLVQALTRRKKDHVLHVHVGDILAKITDLKPLFISNLQKSSLWKNKVLCMGQQVVQVKCSKFTARTTLLVKKFKMGKQIPFFANVNPFITY